MKIGIDARFYGPYVGGGGLGRYTHELLKQLQEIDTQNRYLVFLNREGFDAFQPKSPNFEKRLADVRWYTLAEQLKMPRIIDHQMTALGSRRRAPGADHRGQRRRLAGRPPLLQDFKQGYAVGLHVSLSLSRLPGTGVLDG